MTTLSSRRSLALAALLTIASCGCEAQVRPASVDAASAQRCASTSEPPPDFCPLR